MLDKPMTGLSKLLGAAEPRSATALAPDARTAAEEESNGSLFADLLGGQPNLLQDDEAVELLPPSNAPSTEGRKNEPAQASTSTPDPVVLLRPEEVQSGDAPIAAHTPLLEPNAKLPVAEIRSSGRPLPGHALGRLPDHPNTAAGGTGTDAPSSAAAGEALQARSSAGATGSVVADEPGQAVAVPTAQAAGTAQISELAAVKGMDRPLKQDGDISPRGSGPMVQTESRTGHDKELATPVANNDRAVADQARMPVASPAAQPTAATELTAASPPEFKLEPSALSALNLSANSNGSAAVNPAMGLMHTTTPIGAPLSTTPTLDTTSTQWSEDFVMELAPRLGQADSGQRLRMQLAPEAMGGIELELKQSGDGLELRIVAETSATRALLDDNQALLRERFAAQGLNLLSCECSLADERQSQKADAEGTLGDESQPSDDENSTLSARVPASVPQLLDLYA